MKFGGNADACFGGFTTTQLSASATQRIHDRRASCRDIGIRYVDALHRRDDLLALRHPVRLNDRKAKRRRPDHRRHHLLLQASGLLGLKCVGMCFAEPSCGVFKPFWGNRLRYESSGYIQPDLNILRPFEQITDGA